jgi:sterol desaturase/sphingolipid hydroxylase (fatty acid hydroxylase superfamily)
LPPVEQLVACLLIFEAINYTLHRAMHELRGPVGRLLSSLHAVHHPPPRFYFIAHAVFQPLNGIIIQGLATTLLIWSIGYDQRIVTMFLLINGIHGTISHFNVDIRMGWLNNLFLGPEFHRDHHSTNVN